MLTTTKLEGKYKKARAALLEWAEASKEKQVDPETMLMCFSVTLSDVCDELSKASNTSLEQLFWEDAKKAFLKVVNQVHLQR